MVLCPVFTLCFVTGHFVHFGSNSRLTAYRQDYFKSYVGMMMCLFCCVLLQEAILHRSMLCTR